MIRKIIDVIFLCLILCAYTGCQTPMFGVGEGGYGQYRNHLMFGRTQSSALLTPPSNIGFMYREPVGWENESPRSFRLKNTTNNLHSRCWLDGRQVMPTAWGSTPQAPIATLTGVVMAPLFPPQSEIYIIISVGRHQLKCQLYSGPPPFQATHEMNISFQTNGQGGRTFHINPDHMLSVGSLSAN